MIETKFTILTDEPKVVEALPHVQWVINQPEFKNYIIDFKNCYGVYSFLQTKENNKQIFSRLYNKKEIMVSTEIFDDVDNVIAYVTDDDTINLNKDYLNRPIPEICNTLIHEYCHISGMVHSTFNPSDEIWAQTAPYAIGDYAEYMIKKRLGIAATKPSFKKAGLIATIVYKLKRSLGVTV